MPIRSATRASPPSWRRRRRQVRRRRRREGWRSSIKELRLSRTQITDAGCATLAAALNSGALPALERLYLDDIPASAAAKAAVREAAKPRAAVYS